jgi:hypothetical protein
MHLPRYLPEPVLESPEVGAPYTDLAVVRIDATPDWDAKQVGVAAVIDNLGLAPPTGPFCVTTQILTYFDGYERTDQEFWWYPAGQTFPFRTLTATIELRSVAEGGTFYEILVGVDITEALLDPHRRNNYKHTIWWPFGPRFAPGSERILRTETRVGGNGERKVKIELRDRGEQGR